MGSVKFKLAMLGCGLVNYRYGPLYNHDILSPVNIWNRERQRRRLAIGLPKRRGGSSARLVLACLGIFFCPGHDNENHLPLVDHLFNDFFFLFLFLPVLRLVGL